MLLLDLAFAGLALLAVVTLGTIVHELLHASVLQAAGVPYDMQWLADASGGTLGSGLLGTWAAVELRAVPEDLPPWTLRVASLAPLVLAAPLLAIPAGVVADPFAGENVVHQAVVLGWMACALPSPADFSLVWHAEQLVSDDDFAALEH